VQNFCEDYTERFKQELGCPRDFELEISFKSDAKPVFCKPRSVPFAIHEDLAQEYESEIPRGVWTPVKFNGWVHLWCQSAKCHLQHKFKLIYEYVVITQ